MYVEKCEENCTSQGDLRVRELSCRCARMKNKNRWDIGYLKVLPKGYFNTYEGRNRWIAVCRSSIFAKRGSSKPRLHRRKVFTLFSEGKKGSKGGRIGLLFEKGPLSERGSFSTLPSATSAVPQQWIRLLSCPPLERIVNVPSCLRILFQQLLANHVSYIKYFYINLYVYWKSAMSHYISRKLF